MEGRATGESAKGKEKDKSKRVSFGSTSTFTYESPVKLRELERGFMLDGVCVSHLANDETDRTFPSLNTGIPQYKAREDKYTSSYFKRRGLPSFVSRKEGQQEGSMQGRVIDKFCASNEATEYLSARQREGAGCARQVWGGHTTVSTDPSRVGWHGEEGYRRNTFDLRARCSVFDYQDPFDNPRQLHPARQRTQSAPATIRMMRQKSASIYRSFPGGGARRAVSALPRPTSGHLHRNLATGPVT